MLQNKGKAITLIFQKNDKDVTNAEKRYCNIKVTER
jgi:hypothetical protein